MEIAPIFHKRIMRSAKKKSAPPASTVRTDKEPLDIEKAIPLIRDAVVEYPKAALFELANEGYTSVFEILIACIISIRRG